MKKKSILAIAPYEGLAKVIQSLADKQDELELTVRVGNLNEGLKIANSLLKQNNYDALISRGGTAELLRKELDIPVVDISLSVYDMLRSLKLAENYSGRFAIIGYSTITETAKILSDILRLDLRIITLHNPSEVLPALRKLKNQDYSLVICDMISYDVAQSLGLNALLVLSGVESVQEALKNAADIIQVNARYQLQNKLLGAALANDDSSVLIYDKENSLICSSLALQAQNAAIAENIRKDPVNYLSGDKISVVAEQAGLSRIESRQIIVENEAYIILKISHKPTILVGADKAVSIYNGPDELISGKTSSMNSANLIGKTNTLIEKYATTSYPVLITGEIGVGKEKAAMLLYHYSKNSNRPYYVIDCSKLKHEQWQALITQEGSPLNDSDSTIHLKNIEKLGQIELDNICTHLENSRLISGHRLILSMVTPDDDKQGIREFCLNTLNCLHLPLLPLRERKEDIESIAMLYIAQLNLELGKQVLGFEAEAAARIKEYSWPMNLGQFRRVLTELVTLTDGPYINLRTVELLLKEEQQLSTATSPSPKLPSLNLNLSLEEINREIVREVLQEEGMTREKAAQRLGISRTTLWRMIKDNTPKL
ncbi:MAG: PrpR N-terminal domain-containing protein [Eubacteriales bacterium]|nr:PrpR N-terminal domain-containing protein [Eubacteriales bacterium]